MDLFFKKHYNVDYIKLDFDKNDDNYIYQKEFIKKSGKKYNYYKNNNINNYSFHSPSCLKLYELLKKIDIENKKIIDIGCGKGFALSLFYLFNFKNISGIEIDNNLVSICKKNLDILKIKNINIIESDILEYKNINEYDIYYFYNPFSSKTFELLLSKIDNKISTIIYKNIHIEEENILNKHNFNKIYEFKGDIRNYNIYINNE
jgi:16S rRNA A1518/A1519 N6-dimethyltransferase RsmA/KsgA/DIM1 with predicted DNA glycosylase/AP lyase activity